MKKNEVKVLEKWADLEFEQKLEIIAILHTEGKALPSFMVDFLLKHLKHPRSCVDMPNKMYFNGTLVRIEFGQYYQSKHLSMDIIDCFDDMNVDDPTVNGNYPCKDNEIGLSALSLRSGLKEFFLKYRVIEPEVIHREKTTTGEEIVYHRLTKVWNEIKNRDLQLIW